MPKLVKEITDGGENGRSADGGQLADVSVRTWRVILNSPSEAYNIQREIDVYIGDPHPVNTGVPCVSINEKAEGSSRVVRIVTATYRTTPGSDPQGGGDQRDPKLDPPEERPFQWSVSCQLMEVPATDAIRLDDANNPDQGQTIDGLGLPKQPSDDPVDGLMRLIPIINIRGERRLGNIPVNDLDRVGLINDPDFNFFGWAIAKHKCIFRSLEVQPVVEPARRNDEVPWRGYNCVYEFCVKTGNTSWDIIYPLTSFNIKNDGLGDAEVDEGALSLELTDGGQIKNWQNGHTYATGTQGRKMRANVLIAHLDGGASQRPSAQPVALNENGTPRKLSDDLKVLTRAVRVQGVGNFGDNFANFGL
jgi:hypothetical protein